MEIKKFNRLSDKDKWNNYKEMKDVKWICGSCGTTLTDGIKRADIFSGSSVHCGNCDEMLTRRTGGGQNNPFCWKARKK